ncbi:MAG TPA: tetratricopeptide repeat protein, partial [Anaerolineales bacterium]
DLIRFIDQRADGNPFFAEQILRYLQAEGLLELNDSGTWMLSRGWQSSALPADVMTMLVARLDQLAREVQDVIQTASVLGREFEVQVLSRMLNDEATVDYRVSEAERASVWSPLNELRYLFRHALLRDAAYTMQLQAHRQRLHALAVEALEGLYANELAFHYPELAFHTEQAALVDKARFYLRRAADAARDAYRNTEALDYYTRDLNLVPVVELRERFALTQERAMLFQRLGNWDLQAAELDVLEELAQQLGDPARRARVLMLKAQRLLNIGDFQQCIALAEQALDLARSVMDAEVTLGTYLIVPEAYWRQSRFAEAMQQAREGLRQAAHMARRSEQGSALNLMGLIALAQGEPIAARGYFEQALAIARGNSDRVLEGKSVNNLGNLAGFMDGDYAAARDYYQQAYTIVHERGDRPAEAVALANLGWVAGMQGDFAAAQSYQGGALAIAREVGEPYQEAYTLINLSALAGVQGDSASALRFSEQGLELTNKIGDRSGQAWALLYKGHAHLLARQLPLGQQAFQDSVRIREELGQAGLATEPLAGLILLALETGDLDQAGQWTESILAYLQAGGTLDGTEEPLRIHLACYRALEIRKDPRSRGVLQAAAKLLEAQLSKFRDEEARQMYVQNVPWRLAVQQAWEAARTGAA